MGKLDIIVLAAGKGNRMGSSTPKPLHEVSGVPSIVGLTENIAPLCPKPIIIVGHQSQAIMDALGSKATYVVQDKQLGTGHAVLCVMEALKDYVFTENIMVLPGDHPLINTNVVRSLLDAHLKGSTKITMATIIIPSFQKPYDAFANYGRVKRDSKGNISSIVEVKDASEDEKNICEVNVSYYCFNTKWLWENIEKITNQNHAKEFYLTDIVGIAVSQGIPVNTFPIADWRHGVGFNTPEELAAIRGMLK